MSKNAANKRRARHLHKDEWSRFPMSKVSFNDLIVNIQPIETPFIEMIRAKVEALSVGMKFNG